MTPDGKGPLYAALFFGALAFGIAFNFTPSAPTTGKATLVSNSAQEPTLAQIEEEAAAHPDPEISFGSANVAPAGGAANPANIAPPAVNSGQSNQASLAQPSSTNPSLIQQNQPEPSTAKGGKKQLPALGSISLNQATQADLTQLPGVGPVLAARIIEFRQQMNGFTSLDQLRQVKGIGPKRFQKIAPYLKL